MAKHDILPFFLPMQGCKHICVYCDQRAISGEEQSPSLAEIEDKLKSFTPHPQGELAYYGGSFTCLPRETQREYLQLAQKAIAAGELAGIRISTRPDAVDEETCAFLRDNGVVTVELGVQSFDDETLRQSGRGYDRKQALAGCRAVCEADLTLGVQLMTGLPGGCRKKSFDDMRETIKCGAKLLRIYPTLVLAQTKLADSYELGEYQPQTQDEAVSLCASMLELALPAGLTVLRLGVNPSTSVEKALITGPYHPAFGGLVREELCQRQMQMLLRDYDKGTPALLRFCRNDMPLIFGQARRRLTDIAVQWPYLALTPDNSIPAGELRLFTDQGETKLTQDEYCRLVNDGEAQA